MKLIQFYKYMPLTKYNNILFDMTEKKVLIHFT